MKEIERALYEQEIAELTQMLRHAPGWKDLREAVALMGFVPSDMLLAGFFEDEHDSEYGALVDAQGVTYQFVRSSKHNSRGFRRWARVEQPETLADMFPAACIAVELLDQRKKR